MSKTFTQPALVGFFALFLSASALAHDQTGSLGSAASSVDYYQVTCSDDGNGAPLSMTAQVKDTSPVASPLVSVLVRKSNVAIASTDAVDGDTTFSPLVYVNGGSGVYDVFVQKSATGTESYTLTYHCMTGSNGTGAHTGTTIATKQNK